MCVNNGFDEKTIIKNEDGSFNVDACLPLGYYL